MVSAEGKKSDGAQVAKGGLYGILFLLGAFILLVFLSAALYIIQMGYHLLCGWVIHAWKALPHFFGKWQEAVLPLGCLLMAAVIAHRFVGSWVKEKFPHRAVKIRHTAAALSLVLLSSGAAIAASGVVHQMFWLANGKVIQSNRRSDLTMALNNGRQLMLALMEFEAEKGRYPESFEELLPELIHPESLRLLSWLDTRDGNVPEPWILLRPGFAATESGVEPVIVSPVIKQREMVVVGYGDMSVRSIRLENLAKLFSESRMEESKVER